MTEIKATCDRCDWVLGHAPGPGRSLSREHQAMHRGEDALALLPECRDWLAAWRQNDGDEMLWRESRRITAAIDTLLESTQ